MIRKKNALEWVVFAVGLLLTAGLLGFLATDALTMKRQAPALRVDLGKVEASGAWFTMPVSVTNQGEETGEDVRVEVCLRPRDTPPECAELTFPFVPRRALRRGWVRFRTDPAGAQHVEAHVLSYRAP